MERLFKKKLLDKEHLKKNTELLFAGVARYKKMKHLLED